MRFGRRDAGHRASAAPVHIEDVPFTTRPRSPETAPEAPDAPALNFGTGVDQLQKAERVLGISNRQSTLAVSGKKASERVGQPAVSAQQTVGGDQWSRQSEQECQPMDTARSANGGLKPWPSLQSKNNHASMHDMGPSGGWAPPAHATSDDTSHHHHHRVPHKPSNSTLRSHYEASHEPLSVSQQTSASAARDMGLRKGKPGANRSESETAGRPLKSALKHPTHHPEQTDRPSSKKEGMRFGKMGHFFPGRKDSGNRSQLHPSQLSQYGSSLSVASTAPLNARSPSFSSELPQHFGATSTESTTRPKVFESDVFDSAKVNVRRPPKGIQNWFDGVDISSDEEEQGIGEALPSTFSPYEERSYEAPQQNEDMFAIKKFGSSARSKTHPEPPAHRSSRQPTRPAQNRSRNASDAFVEDNALAIEEARQRMQARQQKPSSDAFIEDNALAIEQARQRMRARQQQPPAPQHRRNSGESMAPSSFSNNQSLMSGAHSGWSGYNNKKHGGESILSHSQLADESLSDSEEDFQPYNVRESMGASSRYTTDVGEASPMSLLRPAVAPRPYLSKRSTTRDTVMTTQTSGSIPIHWSNDEPPIMPPLPRRATEESAVDHTSQALRRLIGRDPSVRMRSRPASSKYESEGSIAGETIDSTPSDISHMMAVTEEEMALLEMMRQKRAAMQKGNISESAQQVLKREQEQLLARQMSAQKAAQTLLRVKEERDRGRTSEWTHEERRDHEWIAGLGSLREEDVDDKLRIERFLASETPLEDVFPFPSPPNRSRASSQARDPAPLEDLLLPRTYTPQPPAAKQKPPKKSLSPVLPSPSVTSGAEDLDDESAQLEEELRQFLGGDGPSEDSAFPLPPKASSKRSNRRVSRANGHLAPVLPSTAEEDIIPPIPNRSPNRMPSYNDEESVLPPKAAKRVTRHRADSDALNSAPLKVSTQYAQASRNPEPPTPSDRSERLSHFLGPNFEANFDSDFPASASTSASQRSNARYDSPSISTSQASPLTPTFPTPLATNDRNRPIEIASNDVLYPQTYNAADQSSLHSAKGSSKSKASSKQHRQSKAVPDLLAPVTYVPGQTPSRMSSVGSCMSASDDVLAAWAELGGVSDGLPIRERSPMRTR